MEVYLALAALIVALWIVWRKRHLSYFKNKGIPGPEPNVLFGNILDLYKKGPLNCQEEWIKKYGRIFGYFYGMKPVLVVADPQILKNVFIKDFNKFTNRELFSPIYDYNPKDKQGQSVLSLPGKKWKEVRSVLTPTFTAAKMKRMAGSINASIETMISVLKEKAAKGEAFDAMDVYHRLTMDIITRTAFGVRSDFQTNAKSKLLNITRLLFSVSYTNPVVFVGLCFPHLRWACRKVQSVALALLNKGGKPNTQLTNGLRKVLDYRRKEPQGKKVDLLQLMIDTKIYDNPKEVDTEHLEIGNAESEDKISIEGETNRPFRKMTDDEIVSTSFTVLLAGYETTSTALTYTTYLIARHQDVQQKLYEEISELIEKGQTLDYGTISKLQYLDKVFNESLRIYPPVVLFNNRFAMEDVQYGDLKIPKGMLIQAPVYSLHHDPEFWDEPEKFDPERFNDKVNTNGIVFLPFGVGPRNCLGMRFAQIEAKLALAHLLHKFKLTLKDERKEEKLEMHIKIRTTIPKDTIMVKLEVRDTDNS